MTVVHKCWLASVLTGTALFVFGSTASPRAAGGLLDRVDHLVYATPDLTVGIETTERLFGVRASQGGQHPGEGTRNALIALGPTSYFEIIGPDPDQPKPDRPRRFGIDDIKEPRLTTWVAKGTGLALDNLESYKKSILSAR